jgi:transposase InsO family protein
VVWAQRVLARRGYSYAQVAKLLGGPAAETIRHWCACWRKDHLEPPLRGRPPDVLEPQDRRAALTLLRGTRGGLSRDSLCAELPEAPVRALRDLHRCWGAARRRRGHAHQGELLWLLPGRVLGIDLTDVPSAALGADVAKLLYARDLASGYVPAPAPLRNKSARRVVPAVSALFGEHGAPLVIKLDNEGAFRSRDMRALLREHGVVALYSPPYYPAYNGATEATIGSQKRRVERIAAAAGQPGAWQLEDVLAACWEHNELARPWGARGPTPRERFDACERISAEEHRLFRDTVAARLREARRHSARIPAEHEPGRRDRSSAMKRSAITNALVDLGYLEMRRRRITPPITSRRTG